MDKRERRRLDRTRQRKARARTAAQQLEAAGRQARAWEHLAAAEQAVAARAYGEAAVRRRWHARRTEVRWLWDEHAAPLPV